jgi:glycosyltransferase involved in cell wall biosynthesis
MAPPIVYDLLRLLLVATAAKPRGIDRVDLGCARHLFESWRGDCFGLLPTPWGFRLFDRHWVVSHLDRVEALWSENGASADDPVLTFVRQRLDDPDAASPVRLQRETAAAREVRQWRPSKLLGTRWALGAPATRAAAQGSVYLNIGQVGWAAPWMARWLRQRPDVRPVFMLHDVIPIEHPQWGPRSLHAAHSQMVKTVARHAAGMIATTATARESVQAALHERGRLAPLPVVTMPLPVSPIFLRRDPPDPLLGAHDYFVYCSAIEPRKNHLMLVEAWKELVRRLGARAPRLVVVGAPAHGGGPIKQQLEGCEELRRHIIVATGLSSPALRQLMAQAKALLMPSLAEGYGLPIAEALTLGTPVLASDLSAHMEVGGDCATYLDPHHAVAWAGEISRLVDDPAYLAAMRQRAAAYRPMTAAVYFARIESFLDGLGETDFGEAAVSDLEPVGNSPIGAPGLA